jgi:2-dehydropantoate 2-reductase
MHVAILGAGALGSVYGARLATLGGCEVSIVARAAGPAGRVRLERVGGREGGAAEIIEWMTPARGDRVSIEADTIIVCVRYEHLAPVAARIGAGTAAVVVMTPMMPKDHARLTGALPGRVLVGMPSVAAYRNDAGVIRYWLPRAATTLVDASPPPGSAARLVSHLERAGIRAKVESNVLARNVATTISFVPLAVALDVAGGIDSLLRDDSLLALALDSAEEAQALARAIGKPVAWASLLTRFVGRFALSVGVRAARSRAPEAVHYVEEHFGRKRRAQNVAMAQAIVELAKERRARSDALAKLCQRLIDRGSA